MPSPLTKLKNRGKSTGDKKNAIKKTLNLVSRPLKSIQQTILIRKNMSNKTLIKLLAKTVIKKLIIQITAWSL